MHTVELLPDDELDSRVREMWGWLLERGLPSLASHPHPTNRPHLTVVTAASIDGLPELPLPIEVQLGAPRMLGRALVLPVTPNAALRRLHALAWSSAAEAWPPAAEWVPHISLALRFAKKPKQANEAEAAEEAKRAEGVEGAQRVMRVEGAERAMGVEGAKRAEGVEGAKRAKGVEGAEKAEGVEGAAGAERAQGVEVAERAKGVEKVKGALELEMTRELSGPVSGTLTKARSYNSVTRTVRDL